MTLSIVLTHVFAWPEVMRGAERYVHELSAALSARGHRVRVLTTSEHPRLDEVLGVPVRGFARGPVGPGERLPPRVLVRFGARCLADVLPRRVDVWHAGSLFDGAAAAVAGSIRPGLRSVLTLHGPVETSVLTRSPQRQAFSLARRVDRVVCVSPPAAAQADAAAGVRAAVVPPGVDASVFCPGGRRSDVPAVLYVGSLTERRKNLPLLLAALALVPDVELHLVGQGDPSVLVAGAPEEVRARVRHLGPLSGAALVDAYRSAWVTALVSEREVFGMVVVESLACGTPAVVLDDGWGASGIVTDGTGERAAATPASVAEAVGRALSLARDPDTVGRCRAVGESYDWQRAVVPRLEEVYAGG